MELYAISNENFHRWIYMYMSNPYKLENEDKQIYM